MSKPIDEQISAFLDDELPAAELDLLLKQVEREPAHRERLARYALIGECLRDSGRRPVRTTRLADRVSAALAAEAAPVARGRPAWQRRVWMAGAAAALAGVAAVFVINPLAPGRDDASLAALAPTSEVVAELSVDTVNATATRRLNPRAAERLTGYLVAHGAYANDLSRNNIDSHLVAARAERASWSLPQTGAQRP